MKTLLSIFKECDIQQVLYQLIVGVPKTKYSKLMERYYSLYCALVETWVCADACEVIITNYKQVGEVLGKSIYGFFGISDYKYGDGILEEPVVLSDVIEGKIEILLSDYLLEYIDEELLCIEVLYLLEKEPIATVSKRYNKELFDYVRRMRDGKRAIDAIERCIEHGFFHLDKGCLESSILEYSERMNRVIKWKELLAEDEYLNECLELQVKGKTKMDKDIHLDMLPPVYRWFADLDLEGNNVDLGRCFSRWEQLESAYFDVELLDYTEAVDQHMRIVVEYNPTCRELPIVFVRNKHGEKKTISEFALTKVLCMDIHLVDVTVTDMYHVFAILMYYMEFPLRVERLQKEYMIRSLIGMKRLYDHKKYLDG